MGRDPANRQAALALLSQAEQLGRGFNPQFAAAVAELAAKVRAG